MANARVNTFVTLLANRTAQGKVPWEETSREGQFRASFERSFVTISVSDDQRQTPDVFLKIHDAEGRLLETIVDTELDSENSFDMMIAMYQNARGKALNINDTLDSMISEMDDNEIPF